MSTSVDGRYLCATNQGIYLTQNGVTYTKVLDVSCNELEQDSDLPGLIFAGCDDSGVFVSDNEGETWEPLPALYRDDIEFTDLEIVGTNWLYATTDHFGILRIELDDQGIEEESEEEPVNQGLQVEQSPCRGSVTITVPPLGVSGEIYVFDVTGRVACRERVNASASQQSIVVSSLSPGVYFTGMAENSEFCRFVMVSR